MLAITIVICIFLFFTTGLILGSIEKKWSFSDELIEILENFESRITKLEKDKK
ncbi:MAG: hypothetical protein LBV03_04080 [Fusobacteriales bacterium]|jgi:preprotein translocase subunit SecG|nr:hypothetical protein [Fusobacteriales bacterium]